MKKKLKMIVAISLCCLSLLGIATYAAVAVYSDEYQIMLAKTAEEQQLREEPVDINGMLFNQP